MISTWE